MANCKVLGNSWHVKDANDTYHLDSAPRFVPGTAVSKMGAAFAHSEPKTTACRRFWELRNRTNSLHLYIIKNTEWTASNEPGPKLPKPPQSAGNLWLPRKLLFQQDNPQYYRSMKTMLKKS